MMITRRLQPGELTVVVLVVTALHLTVTVHTSSISSSSISSSSTTTTTNNNKQTSPPQLPTSSLNSQQQQPQQQETTSSNHADQSQQQQQQQQQQNSKQQTKHHQMEGTKQRSNNDEHDDMVPLATVNNHSRNNQNLLRPPQYVDVSALVGGGGGGGRNMSISGTGSMSAPMGLNTISPNSLLSAKSRSGLPECATQQVCNAIFVRMNHTQRLCECSSNYNWKCSNNLDPQDGHTIELTRKFDKRIYTQIKTCEPLREVRACKSPTDWTLLALQSERSGKAHYVVVCKCPTWAQLEGPYTHNHPPYANIPGIRVYGMLCAHQTARSSSAQTYSAYNPSLSVYPEFPWSEALNVLNTTNLAGPHDGAH